MPGTYTLSLLPLTCLGYLSVRLPNSGRSKLKKYLRRLSCRQPGSVMPGSAAETDFRLKGAALRLKVSPGGGSRA